MALPRNCHIPSFPSVSAFSFSTSLAPDAVDEDGVPIHDQAPPVSELKPHTSNTKLFVGNLSWDVEDKDLSKMFAPYSSTYSKIIRNDQNKSRGFGFAKFSNPDDANEARKALDGSVVLGRSINVAYKGVGKHQQPNRKLFVGNLPWGVDVLKLKEMASEHGEVATANIVIDPETSLSRGFGFVTMVTEAQAESVISALNQQEMEGRHLSVSLADPNAVRKKFVKTAPPSADPDCKLFVGNISWDMDLADLRELFNNFGKVTSARIIKHRDTGVSRGFGFVTMETPEDAQEVVENLNQTDVAGRIMSVTIADSPGQGTTRRADQADDAVHTDVEHTDAV